MTLHVMSWLLYYGVIHYKKFTMEVNIQLCQWPVLTSQDN